MDFFPFVQNIFKYVCNLASCVKEMMGIEHNLQYYSIHSHFWIWKSSHFSRLFLLLHDISHEPSQFCYRIIHSRSNCKHLRSIDFTRNAFSQFVKETPVIYFRLHERTLQIPCLFDQTFGCTSGMLLCLDWFDGIPKTMIIHWKLVRVFFFGSSLLRLRFIKGCSNLFLSEMFCMVRFAWICFRLIFGQYYYGQGAEISKKCREVNAFDFRFPFSISFRTNKVNFIHASNLHTTILTQKHRQLVDQFVTKAAGYM